MKSRQVSKRLKNALFLVFFSVVSLAYLLPIGIVVINSFKRKAYINKYPFSLAGFCGTGKLPGRCGGYRLF